MTRKIITLIAMFSLICTASCKLSFGGKGSGGPALTPATTPADCEGDGCTTYDPLDLTVDPYGDGTGAVNSDQGTVNSDLGTETGDTGTSSGTTVPDIELNRTRLSVVEGMTEIIHPQVRNFEGSVTWETSGCEGLATASITDSGVSITGAMLSGEAPEEQDCTMSFTAVGEGLGESGRLGPEYLTVNVKPVEINITTEVTTDSFEPNGSKKEVDLKTEPLPSGLSSDLVNFVVSACESADEECNDPTSDFIATIISESGTSRPQLQYGPNGHTGEYKIKITATYNHSGVTRTGTKISRVIDVIEHVKLSKKIFKPNGTTCTAFPCDSLDGYSEETAGSDLTIYKGSAIAVIVSGEDEGEAHGTIHASSGYSCELSHNVTTNPELHIVNVDDKKVTSEGGTTTTKHVACLIWLNDDTALNNAWNLPVDAPARAGVKYNDIKIDIKREPLGFMKDPDDLTITSAEFMIDPCSNPDYIGFDIVDNNLDRAVEGMNYGETYAADATISTYNSVNEAKDAPHIEVYLKNEFNINVKPYGKAGFTWEVSSEIHGKDGLETTSSEKTNIKRLKGTDADKDCDFIRDYEPPEGEDGYKSEYDWKASASSPNEKTITGYFTHYCRLPVAQSEPPKEYLKITIKDSCPTPETDDTPETMRLITKVIPFNLNYKPTSEESVMNDLLVKIKIKNWSGVDNSNAETFIDIVNDSNIHMRSASYEYGNCALGTASPCTSEWLDINQPSTPPSTKIDAIDKIQIWSMEDGGGDLPEFTIDELHLRTKFYELNFTSDMEMDVHDSGVAGDDWNADFGATISDRDVTPEEAEFGGNWYNIGNNGLAFHRRPKPDWN